MEEKGIIADEILAEVDMDLKQMAQTVADAINNAQPGAIINQSEEQVRDAHAVFRQRTYQKALSLLERKQQAFSPSPDSAPSKMEQQR